ncbi:MAG: porin family protein [Alphaproteobacteria bacterium]|nr:porin family protein [Alphaproteobacteria bacterium]
MKKITLAICIFSTITSITAYAQNVNNIPEYLDYKGTRYVPISTSTNKSQNFQLSKEATASHTVYNQYNSYIQSPKFGFKPYIGADINYAMVKYNNSDPYSRLNNDKYYSYTLTAGARFNRYLGVELFMEQSDEKSNSEKLAKDFSVTYKTKYNAYGIDFIGYLPLVQNLELLAALGFGEYNFDLNVSSPAQVALKQIESTAWRVGGGIQYNFNQHFALRTMARYVLLNESFAMKNMLEVSLGIRCSF